jgi:hypothetical protein
MKYIKLPQDFNKSKAKNTKPTKPQKNMVGGREFESPTSTMST